jgi:hypothetical protein
MNKIGLWAFFAINFIGAIIIGTHNKCCSISLENVYNSLACLIIASATMIVIILDKKKEE